MAEDSVIKVTLKQWKYTVRKGGRKRSRLELLSKSFMDCPTSSPHSPLLAWIGGISHEWSWEGLFF